MVGPSDRNAMVGPSVRNTMVGQKTRRVRKKLLFCCVFTTDSNRQDISSVVQEGEVVSATFLSLAREGACEPDNQQIFCAAVKPQAAKRSYEKCAFCRLLPYVAAGAAGRRASRLER